MASNLDILKAMTVKFDEELRKCKVRRRYRRAPAGLSFDQGADQDRFKECSPRYIPEQHHENWRRNF